MTKYELMVIAAAAAAFVLINIIMWSIIIVREKKSRKKNAQTESAMAYQTAMPTMTQARPMAPAAGFRVQEFPPEQTVQQRPRVKRSDFVLLDDIVIVHTDERIS